MVLKRRSIWNEMTNDLTCVEITTTKERNKKFWAPGRISRTDAFTNNLNHLDESKTYITRKYSDLSKAYAGGFWVPLI